MLKLEIDQPIKVKLLKQHPRPDTGKFPGNIYTLEVNGVVDDFRATDLVHQAIQEKVREGMTFELVKRQHNNIPDRTVIWVNVEEPSDEYYEKNGKSDNAPSVMLPMIERMLRDLDAMSKDLKYIQGYFTVEKPVEKPVDKSNDKLPFDDDDIPF